MKLYNPVSTGGLYGIDNCINFSPIPVNKYEYDDAHIDTEVWKHCRQSFLEKIFWKSQESPCPMIPHLLWQKYKEDDWNVITKTSMSDSWHPAH